jgi:membrane dipeptidase
MLTDFMAFVFSQKEIMSKPHGLKIDPAIKLDYCHVTSVPPFVTSVDGILREHEWFSEVMEGNPGVVVVRTKNDLARPGLKILFGLQHPPIGAKLSDMIYLKRQGVRFLTIAYELENEYGGGFAAPDAPLTDVGKKFLENMAAAGLIMDLAHAGYRTAREILRFRKSHSLPLAIVASHTASYSVNSHLRNLPDDVLLDIRDVGGIIGIVTTTFMLHESSNAIANLRLHLEYTMRLLGVGNVAVGSDGVYKRLDAEELKALFKAMRPKVDPRNNFKSRFPDQPVVMNYPDRMIRLKNIMKKWFGNEAASSLAGDNLFRFLKENIA